MSYPRQRVETGMGWGYLAEPRRRATIINPQPTGVPVNLPPLPILPPLPAMPKLPAVQSPLPFEPEYSPWFPISKQPWEPGWYDIKAEGIDAVCVFDRRYLFDGSKWEFLPIDGVAWRGLARPYADNDGAVIDMDAAARRKWARV